MGEVADKNKYTETDVYNLIARRYGDSLRYAVFRQVARGTGTTGGSWIDAVVVHLWPSDGYMRSAFEIKVSRSDYLGEINNPGKNKWAREEYHRFYYVAPRGVIRDVSEVPEGCGWLEVQSGRLIERKAPTRRENIPLKDSTFAGLVRARQKVDDALYTARRDNDPEFANAKTWTTAMREVLGSLRVYVDPNRINDVETIKKTIQRLIDEKTSPEKRDRDRKYEEDQLLQITRSAFASIFSALGAMEGLRLFLKDSPDSTARLEALCQEIRNMTLQEREKRNVQY
jgi:hypothetical protein